MSNDDLHARLNFSVAVAAEASEFILRYYRRSDLVVESKRDASPSPRPIAGRNN
jgi:hypothetical protein